MAATPIFNDTAGSDLVAALGGTPSAEDRPQIVRGSEVYDTNCDLGTNELDGFVVTDGFKGVLGQPGTPVEFNLSGATYTGLFMYDGSGGGGWFKPKTSCKRAIIRGTKQGTVALAGGTWAALEINAGQVSALTGAVVTAADMRRAKFTALDNGTGFTTLNMMECVDALIKRAATTSRFDNCDIRFDNRNRSLATTTLKGTHLWYNGGNLTNLILLPGSVLDLRGLNANLTITDATLWDGSEIIFSEGFTTTFSNAPTLKAGGPKWYNG